LEEIGQAVKHALLCATKEQQLGPTCNAIFELAGVKTGSAFYRNSRDTTVTEVEETLEFLPSKNVGRSTFMHIPEKTRVIGKNSTDEEVGRTLLLSLVEDCE